MADDDLKFIDPFAEGPTITGYDLLKQDGVVPPLPGDVAPDQIRGRLWELIYALAARRVFLHSTDHLSDAELYAWLHAHWLPKLTYNLPAECEWNTNVDIIGTGSEEDNRIWLQFYADDMLRAQWKQDFPEDVVPDHAPAPFDRERWLPRQPAHHLPPIDEGFDELDELMAGDSEDPNAPASDDLDDPLKLAAVDRAIHVERPQFDGAEPDSDEFLADADAEMLAGDDDAEGDSEDGTKASPEEMLREPAVGIETENWMSPHDELVRAGVMLPPPEEMTDESLPAKLWELLHELDQRGFYLLHTDHLDDRELYTHLWRENLREPALLPGRSPSGGWYHDFIGTGSEEDAQTWLRYYANDLERAAHAAEFPEKPLPPREPCRSQRDQRLPQGPF